MAQPWTGLPTPPDSPRKRRQQLRESEEVTGIMSIEQYICRTDSYRSTSLNDPPPLPVRTEPANGIIAEIIDKLSNEILSVLDSNNLPHTRLAGKPVAQKVFKPGYPGNSSKTVLRVLYRSTVLPRNMGSARDELVELLRRNKIENVEVEILDIDKCFRPSLFAISAKAPAVALYEDCKTRIIQILNKVFHGAWKTLCLYDVGPNKSKATPTIVVTVQPRTICDWHRLMLDLREVQPRATYLPVEFLPGGLGNLGGNSQLDSMQEDASPQMGDSITVATEDGGGTLGMFSILNYGNETHMGFITNFHVVKPARSATSDVMDKALRRGSSLDIEDETKCQVVRFAPKDSQKTVVDGSLRVSELNNLLYKLHQQKYYREMANIDLPRHLAQNIS